jgi:hypothetical protein
MLLRVVEMGGECGRELGLAVEFLEFHNQPGES